MSSLQGHFLIAMPGMGDPNFHEAVAYICKHDEDGALGIVINRPTTMRVAEVFRQLALEVRLAEVAVRPDPGVVHERVDVLIHRADARGEMFTFESSREVGDERVARHAIAFRERSRQGLERILTACHEDEIVPVVRKQLGEIATNTARRAGDDRDWPSLAATSRSGRRCGERRHAARLA